MLTGMSMGVAAAADFPDPFVVGGSANSPAIVYGTGAGVSSVDKAQATSIQEALEDSITGAVNVDEDSETVFKLEKTSTKYNLGDNITGVIASSIDDDELPGLLAPGKYLNDENAEIDYTQKITIGAANQLTMFEDNDYKENVPTVGFRIPASQTVMTYTLTFDDTLLVTDMPTTDLPIMDKTYYVLSNTSTALTLLDSAEEAVLSEGETVSVGGKSVSLEFISSSAVKFNVEGEITNSLAALATYKLNDGSYVGVKEILYNSKEGTISKVEFSIGSGKLKITNAEEVQINDNAIPGLTGTFAPSANVLGSLALVWAADDALFVTEDASITMPGFEAVSLSFEGLNYPAEETIEVIKGGTTYAELNNFPLKNGEYDINFLYGNSTYYTQLGKDATNRLITTLADGNSTLTFDKDLDDYFVLSWTDASDAESYLARWNNFEGSSTATNKSDLQYWSDGSWVTKKVDATQGDTISLGNSEIMVGAISNTENTVLFWNNSAQTSFDKLFSKEGLTMYLPWLNVTAIDYFTGNDTAVTAVNACFWAQLTAADELGELGYAGVVTYNDSGTELTADVTCAPKAATYVLAMREEDKSETKYAGDWVNVTLGWDASTTPVVEIDAITTSNTDATSTEILETDVWRDFAYSELATEILYDQPDSGQKSVKLVYHGDEVTADVYIASSSSVSTEGAELGAIIFKDSETTSYADKNIVVIGGSCINSAAAALVGGAYCGEEFTASTNIGAGEFMLKGYASSSLTSEHALLVAGYNVEDTVNAATYLKTQAVDTGKEYKGTSTTSASLVVA